MSQCQCQEIESLFDQRLAATQLERVRRRGPLRSTRLLVEALRARGVQGRTLLDIGGGVGAIQHELLAAGVDQATDVDASTAYIEAARAEAQTLKLGERVSFIQGNFVDLAAEIQPADIVTLDRVICCYDNMEMLVSLSAARARKLYGLVYPRDTWWVKVGLRAANFFFRIRRSHYRTYTHSSTAVEGLVKRSGLKRRSYRQTLVWQVVVYSR
jgi:magnesium-protoporphyrin O-methyltransferase